MIYPLDNIITRIRVGISDGAFRPAANCNQSARVSLMNSRCLPIDETLNTKKHLRQNIRDVKTDINSSNFSIFNLLLHWNIFISPSSAATRNRNSVKTVVSVVVIAVNKTFRFVDDLPSC